MSNAVFASLLELYKKSPERTPTEDFITEVLAGILQSDQQLLDRFVNEVLHIDGNTFSLNTQEWYPSSRIDIVFKNKITLCFLENKVDSSEGENQLRKYAELLVKEKSKKQVFLRYCTKYYDKKCPDDYRPLAPQDFYQLRWKDVHQFFETNYRENPLVEAFLTLLEEKKMSSIPEFTYEDLLAMREIPNTLSKIVECLERIQPRFTDLFGTPSLKIHLKQWQRYELVKNDILIGGDSRVYAAFSLREEPVIYITCHCGSKNEQCSQYQSVMEENKERLSGLKIKENKGNVGAFFQKPLSDFVSSRHQFEEITEWFHKKMDIWAEFMKTDTTLKWNLP